MSALLCAFLFIAFSFTKASDPLATINIQKKNLISCSPDRQMLLTLLEDEDISIMPGAGTYHWKISTASDSAQFYFDQGINMYYGFHIIEAIASFKKATKLDPQNPMVWWAQALALGPNINDVGYAASPAALEVTQKAVDLSSKASKVEKRLIVAMAERYSADSNFTREKLNQDYVNEMKKTYQQFPNNDDVAALYADALMLQHPWDLWNTNGTAKTWTPEIRQVLEKLLTRAPNHPGANHYYIHVMEASPFAYKAMPSAGRLGKLTPGLSHMVHMPSHIYLRVGQFNKGTQVNEEAVKQFARYSNLFPAVKQNTFLYQWHNLHMQTNCALLSGEYAYAKKTALELQTSVDTSFLSLDAPLGSYVQYIYMTPMFIDLRYGKWNEILAMKSPGENHTYASILYHFGRGMAYTALNDFNAAEKEKDQMKLLMKDEQLTIPMTPFSPVIKGAECAGEMLSGFIDYKQNNFRNAIIHFEKATEIESNMVYDEPRDWLISPKQYLGTIYIAAGKYKEAQNTFEKDLQVNAENVWSLHGLHQSLIKQKNNVEAAKVKARYIKAAAKSDTKPEDTL
jgi:tetratricopeptide (TPR) repeat protein